MIGWRARLGFMLPPGNPTVEHEMSRLAPEGVSVHFSRMTASGAAGSVAGRDERARSQLAHIEETAALLALVRPQVMVLAHTASSYLLGQAGEDELRQRLEARFAIPFTSAFASVVAALRALRVTRVALGTPYTEERTLQAKAALESHGFTVVNHARIAGVDNIYDETTEQDAYRLARTIDVPEAEAVFLSGVGMPSVAVFDALERDLGKPAVSSASAMMWNALRIAHVDPAIAGYGRLLAGGAR